MLLDLFTHALHTLRTRIARAASHALTTCTLALTLLTAPALTSAQPQQPLPEAWRSWGSAAGANRVIFAQTMWDPDGDGPLSEQLVVGGEFTSIGGVNASRIARFDGVTWHPIGSGFGGRVNALTTWDPDGSGPLSAQLVAGGFFITSSNTIVRKIALWDGSAWQPLGTGLETSNAEIFSLASWDRDGEGPLNPELIAGGFFDRISGVTARNVARWDGSTWRSLGTGLSTGQGVFALLTWDSDGNGPLPPQLLCGGVFSVLNTTSSNIARWDGSSWHPFDLGFNGPVYALTSLDPDADGPLAPQIIAGGSFTAARDVSLGCIARWDGSAWQPLGTGLSGRSGSGETMVFALTTRDADGPGPMGTELVVGGGFTSAGGVPVKHIARWYGGAWHPMSTGVDGIITGSFQVFVHSLLTCDVDATGSLPLQIVAAGEFKNAGGTLVNSIARWDGKSWNALGRSVNLTANAMISRTPDAASFLAEELVVGGSFVNSNSSGESGVVRWNGSEWVRIGEGLSGPVNAQTLWDPDLDGPLPAQLFAAGSFASTGGATFYGISRWDGSSWQRLGTGASSTVSALTRWSPDGDNSPNAQPVIGGFFITAGGVTVNRVARWDGTSWQPLGAGVSGVGLSNAVLALATWDPDGPGPASTQLFAGGEFTSAGGKPINRIARWDGLEWNPLSTGTDWTVRALLVCDPDGTGPLSKQLIAAGDFFTAGGVTVNRIARWDGSQWHPLSSGMSASVKALRSFDPDGPGPRDAQLVAGGEFTTAGGVTVNRIARWDGSTWHPFGTGMNNPVTALTTWDPDGTGPLSPQLVAGGTFTTAGGQSAAYLAIYGTYDPLAPRAPCPADFNADTFVDDTDFVIFAAAYDAFSIPPANPAADLTADGFVDDADFVLFAAAYDEFTCP